MVKDNIDLLLADLLDEHMNLRNLGKHILTLVSARAFDHMVISHFIFGHDLDGHLSLLFHLGEDLGYLHKLKLKVLDTQYLLLFDSHLQLGRSRGCAFWFSFVHDKHLLALHAPPRA